MVVAPATGSGSASRPAPPEELCRVRGRTRRRWSWPGRCSPVGHALGGKEAFQYDNPYVTDPNALSILPAITGEQIRGFATTATKIVLGGGVGKMVDLARADLRNVPHP